MSPISARATNQNTVAEVLPALALPCLDSLMTLSLCVIFKQLRTKEGEKAPISSSGTRQSFPLGQEIKGSRETEEKKSTDCPSTVVSTCSCT